MLKFKKLVQQGDCTVLLVFAVFCSGEGFEMPPPWLPQEGLPTAALWGKWGAGGKSRSLLAWGGGAGVLVARGALGTPAQLLRPPRLGDRDRGGGTVSGTELLILS